MRTWPTLYKLDSKNKIREWRIEAVESMKEFGTPTSGEGNASAYCQIHGVQNGKMQKSYTVVPSGKNIGKANETTAWEQCHSESESIWTKKRDRDGYSETIPTEKPLRPMLALKYKEDGHKIKFPCYVQPKLNGYRCFAIVKGGQVKLVSRKNLEWKSLFHLVEALKNFPDGIYDGELYKHGEDFEKISGAVRRDEPNELSAQVEYHLYDMVSNEDYENRKHVLNVLFGILNFKFLKLTHTQLVLSKEELDPLHDEFVKLGYEGIMVRNKKGPYKINARSKDLQKYKKFDDDEYEIVGATENVSGDWVGTCTFKCKTKEGYEFDVMPEGSYAVREKYWLDWQKGTIKAGEFLTVRHFGYTATEKPVPLFPTGLRIWTGE
jgi:ATP-dependent DNA ligase